MKPARSLICYLLIAATCALTNVAVLVAGDSAGLNLIFSATLSFIVCVLIGFVLHSSVTFEEPLRIGRLWRYTAAMSFNYPLSIGTVWLFHDVLALPMIVAAPCSTITLTLYNWVSTRWAIVSSA